MKFDIILPQQRIDAMNAAGLWPNRIITDYMDDAVAACLDQVAVTGHNSMTGRLETVSYRQLRRLSDRMALGLVALGVEPGDIVAMQLPNWWQVAALYLATVRIGAVINPLTPIFRHRELKFMLKFSEAKVMVVAQRFRGFDYPGMIAEIAPELPHLRHVLAVGGPDERSFEAQLLQRRWEDEMDAARIFRERRPGPDDVTLLFYTSGTTGEPKAVMHTSNTLLALLDIQNDWIGMQGPQCMLMPSPMGHITGFLQGMVMGILLKTKCVMQDLWDSTVAAQLIQDERVTYLLSATPFLADLTHNPHLSQYDTSTLKTFICGGAPVPRVLAQTAAEKLNVRVISVWGMSENGLVTTSRLSDPPEKVFQTDGAALPGMELRVVDADGQLLPPDQEGRLQVRGPRNFVGYLKKPQNFDTDAEGWFDTGDNARMDADGYIRIVGRSKDIIIRGGENIPVVEVEELLYRHPAVQDAAIVAMPDERLGERGCAFVVLREGQSMTFQDMLDYFKAQRLTRSFMPERLEIIPEMPRTPSGKIQKFILREAARKFTQQAAG